MHVGMRRIITFVAHPIAKSPYSKALKAFLAGGLSRYFFTEPKRKEILNI